MWELVATAAVALNAGAGLQAAIGGGPSPGDSDFQRFANRSRLINLMLTTVGTAAAVATYYDEHRGDLWLYAGIATSLGIPFNLLMMAPPTPILQPTAKLVDPYHARRPRSPAAHPTTEQLRREADTAAAAGFDDAGSEGSAFAQHDVQGVTFADDTYGGGEASPPGRRLMYAKSGVLVNPDAFASSWTRKFWFSACLSCLSCGVMLALLASRKDAATYTDTPF